MNRRRFLKKMGIAAAACTGYSLASQCAKQKKLPNIVYILADDMGYGDLSCLNPNSALKTKNMDQLAKQGIIFTDAHSGSAVCTPTRYGVLTGRYAWRTRLKKGVLRGYSRSLVAKDRMTVASFLKQHGYSTGCIGKWHLGLDWTLTSGETPERSGDNIDLTALIQHGPNQLGFDLFFGISASLDMPPYVYIENDRITAEPDHLTANETYQGFWRKGPTGSDFVHENVLPVLTQKAVEYINQHANKHKPFFLYFPLTAPHTPILPTDNFRGKSGTNAYGDFILQVDECVGQVMQALNKNSITGHTLVIFTSDNGCSPRAGFEELEQYGHDPSYVFRGHKADIFEGGHRIPFIAKWPCRITPGSRCDETVCLTDLLATCAAIVGTSLPDNAGEDSINILPALLGKKSTKPLREAIVHHSINGSFSIREGKYKLEFCPGSGGWSAPRPESEAVPNLPRFQLYDLENDIKESRNIINEHPEIVERLTKRMTQYVKNGRSTPGTPQPNDGPEWWQQLVWMKKPQTL